MVTSIAAGVALQFAFSLIAHAMPRPKRGQGWYRAVYRAVQFTAANIDRLKVTKK